METIHQQDSMTLEVQVQQDQVLLLQLWWDCIQSAKDILGVRVPWWKLRYEATCV